MSIARTGLVLYGLGALAVGILTLAQSVLSGHPATTTLPYLACIAMIGVALLLSGLVEATRRGETLQGRTAELGSLAAKLETSLAAVSAVNARLYESETRYKGLVDAQGDAIFRRAPDSRLTYANDAFFKLFGLKPQDAIGRPFAPELHPESRAPYFGSFAGRETGKVRVRYDQYVRTAYGWRWIAWEDYAVYDTRGRLIEIQSVGRDVTERKALEEALTEARDKAEAASRAKSGFLATMSHEIRTPMNGVLGMARLLFETQLAPEQRTYVEAMQQSGESLLALIEDILDFSKIESGALTLEEDDVEPRIAVESMVELLAPRAHAKGIELVAVIAPETPESVLADGIRLRQILANLIGNAVKFTEKGGVRVDVQPVESRDRRMLRFDVHDTGVGIPLEKRQEIFEEFVQADSSHARRYGGSGLGLAISKRLVAAMGGEIGVEQSPGGGSHFWFSLPVIVTRESTRDGCEKLNGLRVALVTRNAVLRDGLAAQIRAAGGEIVSLGLTGALDRPKTPNVDAVLIDAGTESEAELPAWPYSDVRSIVLVTSAGRGKLAELRSIGFAAYLVKPVRASSLAQRVPHNNEIETGLSAALLGDDFSRALFVSNAPPPVALPTMPLRILLAEDNPVNALLTRELLRRRGHQVHEVTSGDAAIAVLAEQSFDLLLTDIHMPGLDGIEAARRIRKDEFLRSKKRMPIVALTADALETGKQACQDAGMNGFLTKPIDPAELDAMFVKMFPVADGKRTREAAA